MRYVQLVEFCSTKTQRTEEVKADLIIGADGAYSTIRRVMAKRPLFNFSQTYIEHGYVELFVPIGKNNEVTAIFLFHNFFYTSQLISPICDFT